MAFTRPRAAQIDFDVTNISDPLIRLNSAETGSADKDVGIVIERGDDTNVAMLYDESADQFVLVNTTEDGSTSGNVTISSYASLQTGSFQASSISSNGAFIFPTTDGSANQILETDGAGNLSWVDVATTLQTVTDNGATTNNAVTLQAQAELKFADSDSSNYVSFRGPATVGSNITWTLPNTDGTDGQMLSTNGAGTLAWADGGGGGGSGSSYPNSTFTTVPGTDGNFDMSFNVAQTSQETPFEAGGTDAFGVNLGSVFNCMDPIGTTESIDYATGEAYVGA
jgi:hypothetical protein